MRLPVRLSACPSVRPAFVGSFICRLIVVTYRPSCFAKAKNSIERKICCLCDFPFGMLVYLAALLCNDDKVLLHSQGRYCRRADGRGRLPGRVEGRVGCHRVPQGAGMLDVRHRSLSRAKSRFEECLLLESHFSL